MPLFPLWGKRRIADYLVALREEKKCLARAGKLVLYETVRRQLSVLGARLRFSLRACGSAAIFLNVIRRYASFVARVHAHARARGDRIFRVT